MGCHALQHRPRRLGLRPRPCACRCDRTQGQLSNCTLPADVRDPPAWTNMRPGTCVLLYLRLAIPGFSNSPYLNGVRQNTGNSSLSYWTGARLHSALSLRALLGNCLVIHQSKTESGR